MSKKRTSYKAYESTGTSKDSHIQLTNSMLMHPAFYTLKPRAQSLYVYCKNACWRKTGEEWKELKESEFYMNKAKYVHTLYRGKCKCFHRRYERPYRKRIDWLCISRTNATKKKCIQAFNSMAWIWYRPLYNSTISM